jgi:hypothetical protein
MLKFAHAAAVAVLLVATPAAADPFRSFLKACVTSDGDAATAVRTANDLGWKPIPQELLSGDDAPQELSNLGVHTNFDPSTGQIPEQLEMLMTGTVDGSVILDAPGVEMDICGIMASGVDAATLTEQVTSHFGGQPQLNDKDYTAWVYSRQNGRITLESELADADDATLEAVLRERPLFAVYVVEEESMSGLMLGVLRSTK